MHGDNLMKRTVSHLRLCGWAILLVAIGSSVSSIKAEQLVAPLTPSVETRVNGDPSALPISVETFDHLLIDTIGRILTKSGAHRSSDAHFAVNGTIRATKLDVTWSGCLFPVDNPPGDGSCPYPIAPVEYRGAGSIELMADLVAAQLLKIAQVNSPLRTLYVGCQPDPPFDSTFGFGLTLLATGVERTIAQHINVDTSLFALPCDAVLPSSSAILDFGARVDKYVVVVEPSLAVSGRDKQRLMTLSLPIENEGDAFATLRDYADELTDLLVKAVVGSLLPDEEHPEAVKFNDPAALRTPAEASRVLRTAGYPKLAGTFVAAPVRSPAGSEERTEPPAVRLEQGLLMLERGEYDHAFQHLRSVVGADTDPGSTTNGADAHRALVDAAYLARRYGEAIKAGESALQTSALMGPSAAEDATAIRLHLVNAYSLRALACLDQRNPCDEITAGETVATYNERVARATDDLKGAARHVAFVRNFDSETADEMARLANNLATAALDVVDPVALRQSDGPPWRTSDRLFAALREIAGHVDHEIEERELVLLGRISILASVVRAPADDELYKAIGFFEEARAIRADRLETGGSPAHPLLDFELAEAFAMKQDFSLAYANARAGQDYLASDKVEAAYKNTSWEILTALFETLARLSDDAHSPAAKAVVEDFKSRFEAAKGLPSLQPLTAGQEEAGYILGWNFDAIHVYACAVFMEGVREATLAMLDLVFERERASKGTTPPECS